MYVYALYSKRINRIYIGITNDINRRLYEHNIGKMKSTSAYRPWELFYCEEVADRVSARIREKYLKTTSGRRFLKRKLKPAPIAQLDRATAF